MSEEVDSDDSVFRFRYNKVPCKFSLEAQVDRMTRCAIRFDGGSICGVKGLLRDLDSRHARVGGTTDTSAPVSIKKDWFDFLSVIKKRLYFVNSEIFTSSSDCDLLLDDILLPELSSARVSATFSFLLNQLFCWEVAWTAAFTGLCTILAVVPAGWILLHVAIAVWRARPFTVGL